jgi:tetratricopeptide (TPR) repeat protein
MLRAWWEKLSRVEAISLAGQVTFMAMIMAVATGICLIMSLLMLSWIPLVAAGLAWAVVGIYALTQSTLFDRTGKAVASITVPSGNSTPSVAQHSHIQAMVMQGKYEAAAAAYREVIATDPLDLMACEQLGQLALRELKDFPTALFAYHQAEQRTTEPRRRVGYALIAAGIYRDNLQDIGKAVVELRRILATYPDAPNAAALRAEIDELKVRHFEGA